MMTCIAIGGGKAAPRRLLSCTARVIFRPAFPQGLSREGKLCAYHLPLETYGFQTAQRDMMTCIAKKEKPGSGLLSGLCLAGFEPATFRVGV